MFRLEIQTPLKTLFSSDVDYLQAEGTDGFFGVLSNHAPMVATLRFGVLKAQEAGGQEKQFCVGDGLFEVNENKAVILVNTAEESAEIDVQRAQAAKDRAEKRLAEKKEDLDIVRAQGALSRAMARLKVAG